MTSGEDADGADPSPRAASSAASTARSVLAVAEPDGTIVDVESSVRRTTEGRAAELLGEPLADLFHPDDHGRIAEAIDAAERGDELDAPTRARFQVGAGESREVGIVLNSETADGAVLEVVELAAPQNASAELERFADSLEELHRATNNLHASRSVDECTDVVINAAVSVLGFDWCLLAAPTANDMFRIEAVSDGAPLAVGDRPLAVDQGVAGRVYRTKEGCVVADSTKSQTSEPTHDFIRASLTASVGEWGVFQALSKTPAAFDDDDLKLAELLATSMATAIERIEQEAALRVQRDELKRQYRRIESLHTVATEMKAVTSREEIYDAVIEAAEAILEFDICIIDEVEGDVLVPTAVGSELSIEDYYERIPLDQPDNIAAKTVRDGETIVVGDLRATEYAPAQSRYQSILSVPLEDWGVFQAGSEQRDAFDATDRRLTELLLEHAIATVGRIDRESELERRATELERQNERLDKFGSLVSHDIRTPLSIATGYLENARMKCDHEDLAEVAAALDRMDALIDDMLALARGSRDDIETAKTVPLRPVVRDRWGDLDAPSATLDLRADLPEAIAADERQLGQIFENLFRNAIEHGGDDVTVRVGGVGDGGFFVADDGPGIPESERAAAFELGQSGGAGTGLGLAIVADIVDAHGWTVDVTESADGGARFEFRPE